MFIKITCERKERLLIAVIEGRVNNDTVGKFDEELASSISDEDQQLLLNLGRLTYINSVGLGVILKYARQFIDSDKRFAICGSTKFVNEFFEMSGMKTSVAFYETQEAAVEGLNQA